MRNEKRGSSSSSKPAAPAKNDSISSSPTRKPEKKSSVDSATPKLKSSHALNDSIEQLYTTDVKMQRINTMTNLKSTSLLKEREKSSSSQAFQSKSQGDLNYLKQLQRNQVRKRNQK